eukprot:CAMPEP_0202705906 /NCGR_PEP_ID=MMETSP1385-20130828/18404_1 /ASSEMBLY_ACC=CAM_ASM_000861 /TAXON_ID=933848 /ORGANISM="Elphidium margaritaceum" /LENGTH=359 /DNA_ID=CAMNT_0049364261 /DNA_START=203 /DNA_END=1282 /DNA_ORIENTATION=+
MLSISGCCGDKSDEATIEYTPINRALTDSADHVDDDEKYARLLTEKNTLKKQSEELRTEMDRLHAIIQSLEADKKQLKHSQTTSLDYKRKYEEVQQILSDTQIKQQMLYKKISHLNEEIAALKESSHLVQQTLTSQIQILQHELDMCKDKLQTYETNVHAHETNKENESGNKTTLTFAENQITIALDEKARADSLSFCTDMLTYNNKHGTEKTFSFLTFLDSLIKTNKMNSFLNKVNSQLIDAAQLLAVLTLIGVIYTVKCMELQNAGKSVRHTVNSNSNAMKQDVKRKVKHLCCYIVRKYGTQQTEKQETSVVSHNNSNTNVEFYGFVLDITKQQFADNIVKWVRCYIDEDGAIVINE